MGAAVQFPAYFSDSLVGFPFFLLGNQKSFLSPPPLGICFFVISLIANLQNVFVSL